ncbi:MAG: hypothetical protein ACXWV8_02755 [Chitinophagaceae bacterium]
MMITKHKLKSRFQGFFLLCIVAMTLSCKKENSNSPEPATATIWLTQKPWSLASYGYDHNANGLIDASEESIRECERDNRYSFIIGGNGLYEDNILSCGNGISEMPFTWRLINNETTLDFLSAVVQISRLNEVQLIIYHDTMDASGQSLRYIQIFTH